MTNSAEPGISQVLRERCAPLWRDLHTQRFLQEMAAGTLPLHKFGFYLGRNILYLQDFARVMALGAAKAPDEHTMNEFAATLQEVLHDELPHNRALFEKTRELEPGLRMPDRMAPTTLAYTRFLLSVAYEHSTAELLAAVLPCAWSYGLIGKENAARMPDHPIYRDWIAFFAGQTYWDALNTVKDQVDRVCGPVSEQGLERLTEIFATASRLERAFWTMAYNEDGWP